MKQVIFIQLLLVGLTSSLAQDIIVKEVKVGSDLENNIPLKAKVYELNERIHDYTLDSVNGYITFYLRKIRKNKWLANKGSVIRYDIATNRVLWSKEIAYQNQSIMEFNGVTISSFNGGKSYSLDNENGQKKWEIKNSLITVDSDLGIGIGYALERNKKTDDLLQGIDMKDGSVVWSRKLSREYGWNGLFYANDSTLLIVAEGLHTVNLTDGTGWDYQTITGKKDHTASAVGTGLGIASALLTGFGSITTGYDLVSDVCSNVIYDSTSIYFASKERIIKLDHDGNIVWKNELPDDMTSKSIITKMDGQLLMMNRGYAYMGNRQLPFGSPFIASFDIVSGSQRYLKSISERKDEVITALHYDSASLYSVSADKIQKIEISSGEILLDKPLTLILLADYGIL